MYLVDTNVWLDRLLEQPRSDEVGRFLSQTPPERLFMTDFALFSIAIIMSRLKRTEALLAFLQDTLADEAVGIVRLQPLDMERVVDVIRRFGLDFDDAYQYVAAERHGLTLVSFDRDFDRTDRGRKTPSEVVAP